MGIREAKAEEKQVKLSGGCFGGGMGEQLCAEGAERAPASQGESGKLVLIAQLRVVKQQNP